MTEETLPIGSSPEALPPASAGSALVPRHEEAKPRGLTRGTMPPGFDAPRLRRGTGLGLDPRVDAAEEITFSPYDTADYLETEEDIAAYLDAVMEEGGDE
jgi:hypothetical protein